MYGKRREQPFVSVTRDEVNHAGFMVSEYQNKYTIYHLTITLHEYYIFRA